MFTISFLGLHIYQASKARFYVFYVRFLVLVKKIENNTLYGMMSGDKMEPNRIKVFSKQF